MMGKMPGRGPHKSGTPTVPDSQPKVPTGIFRAPEKVEEMVSASEIHFCFRTIG